MMNSYMYSFGLLRPHHVSALPWGLFFFSLLAPAVLLFWLPEAMRSVSAIFSADKDTRDRSTLRACVREKGGEGGGQPRV